MVQTCRQQANFDEFEEEAEFYHRTDIDDTRIMMENGLEAEGIDRIMGRTNDKEEDFERQLQELRRACVSAKSQNNYLISVTHMINWFAMNINEVQYDGFIPLMQSWQEQLLTFDNDMTRKIWIRSKLDNANPADQPIDFNPFQAGKLLRTTLNCFTSNITTIIHYFIFYMSFYVLYHVLSNQRRKSAFKAWILFKESRPISFISYIWAYTK